MHAALTLHLIRLNLARFLANDDNRLGLLVRHEKMFVCHARIAVSSFIICSENDLMQFKCATRVLQGWNTVCTIYQINR